MPSKHHSSVFVSAGPGDQKEFFGLQEQGVMDEEKIKRCPIFVNHSRKKQTTKTTTKIQPTTLHRKKLPKISLLEHQYFFSYLAYNSFCSSHLFFPWHQLSFGTQVLCVECCLSQPYSEKVELNLKSEEGFETTSFGLNL